MVLENLISMLFVVEATYAGVNPRSFLACAANPSAVEWSCAAALCWYLAVQSSFMSKVPAGVHFKAGTDFAEVARPLVCQQLYPDLMQRAQNHRHG